MKYQIYSCQKSNIRINSTLNNIKTPTQFWKVVREYSKLFDVMIQTTENVTTLRISKKGSGFYL